MKKNYFTLATLLFSVSMLQVFAGEAPKAVDINKLAADATITIDGIANEAVWTNAVNHGDFRLYPVEASQDKGATDMKGSWKAFWTTGGMYVLVSVTADDIISDGTVGADWEQDGVEIYFDMNVGALADHGGKGSAENAAGHYDFYAKRDVTTDAADHSGLIGYMGIGEGADAALVMTGNASVLETYIPWTNILDKDGNTYAPSVSKKIGFDICLVDNDNVADRGAEASPRTRQFWSANGVTEPWAMADSIATATLVTSSAIAGKIATEEVTAYVYNNVLKISKSINGQLVNMVGQNVLKVNGNSVNIAGLKQGAYILVSNDNKLHKKIVIK